MTRSNIEQAASAQRLAQNKRLAELEPFLAVVTGQSGGMVTIRELGVTTGATELYGRLPGFKLATDDLVVGIRVSGKPFILPLQNTVPVGYELDVPLEVPALTIGGTPVDPDAAGGITVDALTGIDTVLFDGDAFNTAESPSGTATVDLAFGTGAGQPAEGDHAHVHDHDADYADIAHSHDAADVFIPIKGVNVNPGLTTATTWGMPAPLLNATVSNADAADGPWLNHATAASSGSATSMRSDALATVFRRDWLPEVEFAFKTGGDISSIRIWVGLFDALPNASGDPTLNGAGFRYDTSVDGTAFWRTWSNDNSGGGAATTTTVAIAINTPYRLRVKCLASSIEFYINGVLVATHSTNLPVSTAMMGYNVSCATLTSSSRSLKWGRIAILHE